MMTAPQFQHISDIEGLAFNCDAVPEYDETIETASEDVLRNWLLGQGYTSRELDQLGEAGFTIRDLAETMHMQGHTFP